MRLKSTLAGAALVAGATLVLSAPAQASIPICAGTENEIAICVEPTGGTLYENCVYVVTPPCMPVSVPGPIVWCEGAMSPNCDPWH